MRLTATGILHQVSAHIVVKSLSGVPPAENVQRDCFLSNPFRIMDWLVACYAVCYA